MLRVEAIVQRQPLLLVGHACLREGLDQCADLHGPRAADDTADRDVLSVQFLLPRRAAVPVHQPVLPCRLGHAAKDEWTRS